MMFKNLKVVLLLSVILLWWERGYLQKHQHSLGAVIHPAEGVIYVSAGARLSYYTTLQMGSIQGEGVAYNVLGDNSGWPSIDMVGHSVTE